MKLCVLLLSLCIYGVLSVEGSPEISGEPIPGASASTTTKDVQTTGDTSSGTVPTTFKKTKTQKDNITTSATTNHAIRTTKKFILAKTTVSPGENTTPVDKESENAKLPTVPIEKIFQQMKNGSVITFLKMLLDEAKNRSLTLPPDVRKKFVHLHPAGEKENEGTTSTSKKPKDSSKNEGTPPTTKKPNDSSKNEGSTPTPKKPDGSSENEGTTPTTKKPDDSSENEKSTSTTKKPDDSSGPKPGNRTPDSSHFAVVFLVMIAILFGLYALYHNRQKIIAVVVEGRSANGRGVRDRYRKLDNESLEPEARIKNSNEVYVY